MEELYNKLEKYSIKDAIEFEQKDRQFLALNELWNKGKINKDMYFFLIIANALICYQLSGKGEDYWEEFSEYIILNGKDNINIIEFFGEFLTSCKNNKRFTRVKMRRIEKISPFWDTFVGKGEYYYENMTILRDDLSEIMKQREDAKTIVFAVKMFSYGARTCYNKIIYFPEDIDIPVDSRLIKIFEKYNGGYLDIKDFYLDLSKKLRIPQLHLDAILWNSSDLI